MLGPEPRALGSLPHTLDALGSLLQGLARARPCVCAPACVRARVRAQLLWKAAVPGDGWESWRRAVGFQMKGPAVWGWALDRPGHSVPLLHTPWLLLTRFSLASSHGQGLPLPPDSLIFS